LPTFLTSFPFSLSSISNDIQHLTITSGKIHCYDVLIHWHRYLILGFIAFGVEHGPLSRATLNTAVSNNPQKLIHYNVYLRSSLNVPTRSLFSTWITDLTLKC
jgi:hypothetical protein